MTTNHHRPMSQPERGFFRDVYSRVVAALVGAYPNDTPESLSERASAVAFESVEQYRRNITWRSKP